MDIYALTRKRRPSRLTMAQTSSERLLLPNTENTIDNSISVVTGPPTRLHWKVIYIHIDYQNISFILFIQLFLYIYFKSI